MNEIDIASRLFAQNVSVISRVFLCLVGRWWFLLFV